MTTTDINAVAILDNGEQLHLFGNGITDTTGGNVYVRDISGVNTKNIGEFAQGRRIRALMFHASIGSVLTYVKVYDASGATVLFARAGELDAGARKNYNLVLRGLDIPLSKGVYIFAMTAD